MLNFLITGGTGFIGRVLVNDLLSQGHSVTVVTRRSGTFSPREHLAAVPWPTGPHMEFQRALERCDCVVNLAGEPIADKRWTPLQKERILQSRTRSTRIIVEGLSRCPRKPACFISASAVGFYGPRGNEELDERSSIGLGFLAETCRRWEEAARSAESHGVRVVLLRIGIVLGTGGGALAKMLFPFQWGLGGPLGSGRQWMSWIHIRDLIHLIQWAQAEGLSGVFNATAPHPVSMREFAVSLGRVLKRPAFMPTPGFVLRILLGEMADMLLTGQKVFPKQALESGFHFEFETLEPALRDILCRAA